MRMTRKQALEYLNSRSRRNSVTGCLVWVLSSGSHGYAQGYDGVSVVLAHRLRWWAEGNRLPNGRSNRTKKVLHTCDNRRCNEITHLFLGTNTDNCHDKMAKGRGGYGPKHAEAISRGWKNARPILPRKTVRLIFREQGKTNREIAAKYNSITRIVREIRRRNRYMSDTEDL